MLKEVTSHIPNVEIKTFGGLTVDFAKECEAAAMVRGLRAVTDFEYELQIAQLNRILNKDVDTVFLITDLKYAYLSSSIVKEVAKYGGDITSMVPHEIIFDIHNKIGGSN